MKGLLDENVLIGKAQKYWCLTFIILCIECHRGILSAHFEKAKDKCEHHMKNSKPMQQTAQVLAQSMNTVLDNAHEKLADFHSPSSFLSIRKCLTYKSQLKKKHAAHQKCMHAATAFHSSKLT